MEFGQTLAEYVKSVTLDKVPQRDIDVAKLAILDQIGVAMAGVGEDPGVKVQAMVDRCTGQRSHRARHAEKDLHVARGAGERDARTHARLRRLLELRASERGAGAGDAGDR